MTSKSYYSNIENDTIQNRSYRRVHYTDDNIQIVLMALRSKEEIGEERHPGCTQFIRIEQGIGLAIVEGKGYILQDGTALTIPPGQLHNIINTSVETMHLYTIYSPPQHPHDAHDVTKPLDD